MKLKIDINCDLGESFGEFKIGNDAKVMPYITSANVACGFPEEGLPPGWIRYERSGPVLNAITLDGDAADIKSYMRRMRGLLTGAKAYTEQGDTMFKQGFTHSHDALRKHDEGGGVVAIGVLLDDQGRVLMGRRTDGKWGDKLVLPGGHVGPNETIEEGCAREFEEETGVPVGVKHELARRLGEHDVRFYLLKPLGSTPPRNTNELRDLRFVDPSEVETLPDNQQVVEVARGQQALVNVVQEGANVDSLGDDAEQAYVEALAEGRGHDSAMAAARAEALHKQGFTHAHDGLPRHSMIMKWHPGDKVYLDEGEVPPPGTAEEIGPRGGRFFRFNPGVKEHKDWVGQHRKIARRSKRPHIKEPARTSTTSSPRLAQGRTPTEEDISEVKTFDELGMHGGLWNRVSSVVTLKPGAMPSKRGFSDTRLFYKRFGKEVRSRGINEALSEFAVFKIFELLQPGLCPDVFLDDDELGHAMRWVDEAGFGGNAKTLAQWGYMGPKGIPDDLFRDHAMIAMVDAMTGNPDRHGSNVMTDGRHMYPIDSGFAFIYGDVLKDEAREYYGLDNNEKVKWWGYLVDAADKVVGHADEIAQVFNQRYGKEQWGGFDIRDWGEKFKRHYQRVIEAAQEREATWPAMGNA